MTPKEHDQLVAALAENDRFIAEQYARVRALTVMMLDDQRFHAQRRSPRTLEFANITDGIADCLRMERKVLRRARQHHRLIEEMLAGRIPGSPE